MSLTSAARLIQYTLSGAGQALPTTFKFFDAADIKVTKTVAGVDTVLVITTDYTITGGAGVGGVAAVGNVVMVAGVAGDVITIEGNEPQTQLTDLTQSGPFPAAVMTAIADRLTILAQQLKNRLDRCISVPNTSAVTPPLTLAQRTSSFPFFDAAGVLTTLTIAAVLAGGVPVAANQVYAGPNTGGPALPTYRPLVFQDLTLALSSNVNIGTIDGSLVGIGSAGVAGNMLTLGGTFYQTGLQINTQPTATGNGQALATLGMNLSFSSSIIGGYTGLAGYGIVVSAGSLAGSGSFTTLTGIQIGNVSGAATNYSLRTFNGIVSIGDTTNSTTTATGAVQLLGGMGVAKNVAALTFNGNTFTTGTAVLTGTAGKTLAWSNTITLAAGADSQTFTFPAATATIAGLGTVQSFTGAQTFTGTNANTAITITQVARTSGILPYFKLTIPADTGITAGTSAPGFQTVSAIRTWATTGTVPSQSEYIFAAPTYASASASQTFTKSATVAISGAPIQGINALLGANSNYSLWIQSGRLQVDGIAAIVAPFCTQIYNDTGGTATLTNGGLIRFSGGGDGSWYYQYNTAGAGDFSGVGNIMRLLITGVTITGALAIGGAFTGATSITHSDTSLIRSSVALTNGAAAGAGTITNAPAAGNPTKWVPIVDNGTTRYIPAW